MKTAQKYLRREILASTLLVLGAFLCLFTFFDFLAELEDVGKGGYDVKHAIIFVALSIPSRAYEIMPIAVLIGSLYALTQFARNSELTVLRASGVSSLKLLGALLKIGMIFVVTTFVLGEYIAPPLERIAQKSRLSSTNASVPQALRTGMWVRDGRLFVNMQRVLPDTTLEKVKIFEFDDAHHLMSINMAQKGTYSSHHGWLLTDVQQTRFFPDKVVSTHLPHLRWSSELTPSMVSVVMMTPERMAISSLYQYVRHLEANAQNAGRYEIAFWKKLVYPLAGLVMMGLALPFSLGNQRSVNVGARIMTGVMLGIGFYLLNGLFSNLGMINNWPPFLSATAPSLAFFLLAVALMWSVDRR